jgi:allantoinase
VTTTLEALRIKREAVREILHVDVGFWGGVVPGNAGELDAMVDAGVLGFKAFLVHSGIDEFPEARERDLDLAMPILARRGVPLLVHAELGEHLHEVPGESRRYADFLASRPRKAEDEAIRFVIDLCRRHRCRVHVVHLSSSDAIGMIADAKAEGLPITVETCPHYLTFAAEEIPDGQTQFKCAPPIREAENREKLWAGLRAGHIDFVVSDHSPCTPHLKKPETGDFLGAWGGISSVQLTLPNTWTGASARSATLDDLARWLCERTARLAGLSGKGVLAPGFDADVVVWDPDTTFTVDKAKLHHRHKVTPYDGRLLRGAVVETILRGETIHARGEHVATHRGLMLPGSNG